MVFPQASYGWNCVFSQSPELLVVMAQGRGLKAFKCTSRVTLRVRCPKALFVSENISNDRGPEPQPWDLEGKHHRLVQLRGL